MIRSVVLFAVCGGLLLNQASAQDAATEELAATVSAKNLDMRKMYEDIEIMRRLLQGKFEKLSSARTSGMGDMGMMGEAMEEDMSGYSAMGMMSMGPFGTTEASPAITIDGVYLSGHGIVFTVNLEGPSSGTYHYPARDLQASACIKCHVADKQQIEQRFSKLSTNKAKPLTDWEKTRQDVLGIGDTGQRTTLVTPVIDVCHPGMISEVVWQVLGVNGRYFSELPAAERVTVAITLEKPIEHQGATAFGPAMVPAMGSGFRGSSGSGRGRTGFGPRFSRMGTALGGSPGTDSGGYGESGASSGGFDPYGGEYGSGTDPMAAAGSETGPGKGKSTYRDHLLLGDLHMQQNKPAQALKAYEVALLTLAGSESLTAKELEEVSENTKNVIFDLHQKLAQAALANNQAEVAKTWVERLIELQKGSGSKTAPADEAKRLPLPGRLIISAEKSLLDQVDSGISLEEFKTRAKVEHLSLKE